MSPALALSEKEIQRACWRLLKLCGARSWWLSQARHTQQTKGLSDILTFTRDGRFAFVEVKRAGGKQRPDQVTFQSQCHRCSVTYLLVDDVQQLADWLGSSR